MNRLQKTEASQLFRLGVNMTKTALETLSDDDCELRALYADQARFELKNRALRKGAMPDLLFGEPAWDMLLELYVCDAEQSVMSVTSLCAASGQPQTTALRWIAILEEMGFVTRSDDGFDRRRKMVQLAERGRLALEAYFRGRLYQLI